MLRNPEGGRWPPFLFSAEAAAGPASIRIGGKLLRSRRLAFAGAHLLLSMLVGMLTALVVFLVWYPPPYAALAGGVNLFLLLTSVDMVLGPTLTATVASPSKGRSELVRDLTVIVFIQVAAFAYGIYSIASARPAYLSFEVDHFRVVSAAEVDPQSLADAPPQLRSLSWLGPRMIAAVKPTLPTDQLRAIELGLAGIDLSAEPRNWRDYSTQAHKAWIVAQPAAALLAKFPSQTDAARDVARRSGRDLSTLRYLPVVSRRQIWSALIAAPEARVVGFLPVDGFN